MKKIFFVSIFACLLFILWACEKKIDYLSNGYDALKNWDLNSAENYFIIVLNNSKNQNELSEASEGLGWVNLLKENYSSAENYFNNSLSYNSKNVDAYLGLMITYWENGRWENLIFAGQDFENLAPDSYKLQILPGIEITWLDCMELLAMGYFMENQIDLLNQLSENIPSDDFIRKLQEAVN